jgi:integrase
MAKRSDLRDRMRGIFLRGRIYYYQPSQKRGARPPMISLETDDPDVAIAKAAEIRKVPILNPSTHLLAEVQAHLEERLQQRKYTRPTAANKLALLKRWIMSLGGVYSLTDISTPLLQQQYNQVLEKTSPATAHKFIMSVRAFLGWAVERNKLRANPAIGVREVHVPDSPRVRFCSRDLRDKLIADCDREDLLFILMVGFHAGLRKNEIIQAVPSWFVMESRNIDLHDTATFRFNDKKRRRVIPMRRELHDFIAGYGLREPFMLRPKVKHGKGLYRYDFERPFSEYMEKAGVPWVTPHVMRHTFASLLVMGDRKRNIRPVSIFKVANWLGDTVPVAAKHYAHLEPADADIEETDEDLTPEGDSPSPDETAASA